MADLRKITAFLERELQIGSVVDYPNALNGLQVERSGSVKRIVAAVDACEFTIQRAVEMNADLLLVHHGLFWAGLQPVTGAHFRKLQLALSHNLAIYSAHLPLDLHPRLGNNALLCRALRFTRLEPFFFEKGQHLGFKASVKMSRADLVRRVTQAVGGLVHLCPGGPAEVRKVGVVTGGAGAEVARAAAEGVDTFITGEGPHHSWLLAEELGINLFYAGHYATETFGVKALAGSLARRFQVKWEFIDHPTGL